VGAFGDPVPVGDPSKPGGDAGGGAAVDPGKPVLGGAGGVPVAPNKPGGGIDVGGAGPSGLAFAGQWRYLAPKGCPGCALTVADAGGFLRMTSNEGWQVELILGADGDPSYATGEGLWLSGPLAGQGLTVDAFLEGPQLRIIRSVAAGYVEQGYSR
jgi:hypothetical protein